MAAGKVPGSLWRLVIWHHWRTSSFLCQVEVKEPPAGIDLWTLFRKVTMSLRSIRLQSGGINNLFILRKGPLINLHFPLLVGRGYPQTIATHDWWVHRSAFYTSTTPMVMPHPAVVYIDIWVSYRNLAAGSALWPEFLLNRQSRLRKSPPTATRRLRISGWGLRLRFFADRLEILIVWSHRVAPSPQLGITFIWRQVNWLYPQELSGSTGSVENLVGGFWMDFTLEGLVLFG